MNLEDPKVIADALAQLDRISTGIVAQLSAALTKAEEGVMPGIIQPALIAARAVIREEIGFLLAEIDKRIVDLRTTTITARVQAIQLGPAQPPLPLPEDGDQTKGSNGK